MREPQTYLLIEVDLRLSCMNMRQFSKICKGQQKSISLWQIRRPIQIHLEKISK